MEGEKVDKEALEKDENHTEANAFVRLKERMSKKSKGKGKVKSDWDKKAPISSDNKESKEDENMIGNDKNK